MNIYKSSWKGSELEEVKSGVASFECYGEECKIYLDEFSDFMNICNILDATIEQAEIKVKQDIFTKIRGFF